MPLPLAASFQQLVPLQVSIVPFAILQWVGTNAAHVKNPERGKKKVKGARREGEAKNKDEMRRLVSLVRSELMVQEASYSQTISPSEYQGDADFNDARTQRRWPHRRRSSSSSSLPSSPSMYRPLPTRASSFSHRNSDVTDNLLKELEQPEEEIPGLTQSLKSLCASAYSQHIFSLVPLLDPKVSLSPSRNYFIPPCQHRSFSFHEGPV